MSGFIPIDVIRQVKMRPGIYNKDELIPPRREHRQQLWMEVAESVTPPEEWANYTEKQKQSRVADVASKWRNLRDHFYREIKLIEGGDRNKKRKYIYFDEMEFVRPYIGYKLPPLKKRMQKDSDSDQIDTKQDYDSDFDMNTFLKRKIVKNEKNDKGNRKILRRTRSQNKLSRKNNIAAGKTTAKQTPAETVIDNFNILEKVDGAKNLTYKIRESDLSFCLSLVPTLRGLSGARKLSAKIDILKVLHKNLNQIERNKNDAEESYVENEEMAEDYELLFNDNGDPLNNSNRKNISKLDKLM